MRLPASFVHSRMWFTRVCLSSFTQMTGTPSDSSCTLPWRPQQRTTEMVWTENDRSLYLLWPGLRPWTCSDLCCCWLSSLVLTGLQSCGNALTYSPDQLPPENSSFLERNFVCRFRCLLDNCSGFLVGAVFQGLLFGKRLFPYCSFLIYIFFL